MTADDEQDRPLEGAQQAGGRERRVPLRCAGAQPERGQGEDEDEEEDRGHRQREDALDRRRAPEAPAVGHVALGVRRGEADDEAAGEGEGQAAQPPEHRGGVGVDDQQREDQRLQLDPRRHQDAGDRGQRGADGPAEGRQLPGPAAEEPDQGPVVDHAAHGDAGPGPIEEEPQPDGDGDGGADGDDLLVVDVHAEEGEPVEAEELRHGPRRRLPDVVVDEPEQEERQPHRDGQRGRHVGRVHPLDDRAFDHRAQQRRQHADGQEQRQRLVQVPAHRELPVDERHEHADGAVRDVEDARGRVRHHQAAGRDGVGRAQHQADDRVLEKCVHRCSALRRGVAHGDQYWT